MSIQTPSAYNPADRIKVWFNNLLFSTIPRRLSFSPDFTITEDPTNNFFNIGLVAGGAGSTGTWDPNFAEALTHKTITDATNIFPSNFAKTNAVNTWTLVQNFPTSSQVNSDNIVTLIATQMLKNKDLTDASNTFPTSLATLTGVQALTNKDLTDATNTFPTSLATLTTSQTLTHKDLTGATNTFPTTLVVNNANNSFGAFYEELSEIAKPASPASGKRRVYVDSTTHAVSSVDSGGVSHNLEAAGTTITKGKATFSGNGSTKVFNIAHSLGSTPTSLSVTPGSDNANHGQDFPGDSEGAVWWATADATNIIINYTGVAPASGTNNLVYWWIAYA
jgi:hypothetical protein